MKEKIAILIACLNEEKTIGSVIESFKKELPNATIYVFDNNSTDMSAQISLEKGAVLIKEKKPGKGHVVSAMFQKVEADVYVMVDGDNTYSAEKVHDLIEPIIKNEADMVVGTRIAHDQQKAFRKFHTFGNRLVITLIRWIFKYDLRDVMSGYRAFNREIANTLPLMSHGFEIETEITLQALYRDFVIKEIDTPYGVRPKGSFSKLKTFGDGFKVIGIILCIFKDFKPLTFFGGIGIVFLIFSIIFGIVVVKDFTLFNISRIAFAILSLGLGLLAFSFAFIGIMLTTINARFKELYTIFRRGKLFSNK